MLKNKDKDVQEFCVVSSFVSSLSLFLSLWTHGLGVAWRFTQALVEQGKPVRKKPGGVHSKWHTPLRTHPLKHMYTYVYYYYIL